MHHPLNLSLNAATPPRLPDATAAGHEAISLTALSILDTLCQSEGVSLHPVSCVGPDPAMVRRELHTAMEKLGYFSKGKREPRSDREALERLRDALPSDDVSVALIFLLRGLTQSNLTAATEELIYASEWARRAVYSPL